MFADDYLKIFMAIRYLYLQRSLKVQYKQNVTTSWKSVAENLYIFKNIASSVCLLQEVCDDIWYRSVTHITRLGFFVVHQVAYYELHILNIKKLFLLKLLCYSYYLVDFLCATPLDKLIYWLFYSFDYQFKVQNILVDQVLID